MLSLTTEEQLQQLIAHWQADQTTISTCESCTGGYIASQLTLYAGSSRWYKGGIVTYHTELKQSLVAVPATTIERYGVVSVEVAEAMAKGARQACRSTLCIATTGLAGPSGGSAETPVGTVCIALDTPRGCHSARLLLAGSREAVIRQTYCEVIRRVYLWELKSDLSDYTHP